jgi:multiple sugar transport system permease protein
MSSPSLSRKAPKTKHSKLFWREVFEGYGFIMPVVLGLLIWTAFPMIASLVISFTDYPILKSPEWVGLQNYIDIFTRPTLRVLHSLRVTLVYAFLAVPLSLVAALGAALLLNQKLPGMNFFRTTFYMPTIVPGLATAFVWGWLLNPNVGLVNELLEKLGLPRGEWFTGTETALPTLIALAVWGIGPTMVVFLAGLQAIPESLYEAAKIDGASDPQQFWNITLPQLSPTIFFNLITGVIGAFQYFLTAYVLTNGGPLFATFFYNLNLYEKAFKWQQMGLASAMAWVMFVIILVFTLILFRFSDALVYYEVKK